ncbi:MAG: transcription termination factor NusA [Candidatus Nealsonbacteria bacterium RIFCSPHIGHO2_01_FULL_43_31]|uniref:Transcription termination/antitermination protein NusA n=2 Tax=Candidatus Nealsoniibacteriota TaxID=1817911 RepID=A0A1G2E716_9BACT|nr:MAG: Transcription termination factor NusA [Parcubacteria group bacterium GW2011_GWB1_43_6]OGZ19902.1 MAG: transcription termination factor NusA [Candidatus Nealsonbacteria bacterium RIFCSPHIGHO2_01_FULL_43_31]OGZ21664.1 MAG: transcription termination factor NusA [Candidatus Nealsonbacteria bacterium RIFCSPHIGHO2_02_FULL_43_13]OGZ25179.1 MAG: transcription termination factor NusA [Candidatus Nealsonbacteria bacterium RIFCSPLOWO2_01_FULL_43_36]
MDLKNFMSAIAQIAEEKGIPKEKVIETIEMAIAAAYKKDYGKKGQITKAKLDLETGELKFWQVKQAVDKDMIYSEEELAQLKEEKPEEEKKIRFNPEKHVMINEAKKTNPKIKVGEDLEIPLEEQGDYGRIAAQTAKQVILQRIREAERNVILDEYKTKEGEIISGIVQRVEGRTAFLDIGKILGILPREEQVPNEFYRPGQRLKVFVLKVEDTPKGPAVFLSRAYPKLISKLFELEVPEVSSGAVVIKSVAREAGSRSKIAVASTVEGVDPIGSMVGQRGTRVTAVINELGGEKIDIIEWSEEAEKYLANSLSPAKVVEVRILPKNKALVVVPEDQLSLAIGKDGQNVRLAAKLTGWKIDVRSPENVDEDVTKKKSTKKLKTETNLN